MNTKRTLLCLLFVYGAESFGVSDGPSNPVTAALVAGAAIPTVNGGNSLHDRFTGGAELGYRLNDALSLGGYVTYSELYEKSSGLHQPFLFFGVEADFWSEWITGLYGGLKMGFARGPIVTQDATGASFVHESSAEFSFGPTIGYDYALGENFWLGGELYSMFSVDNKYSVVHALAKLKIAFSL